MIYPLRLSAPGDMSNKFCSLRNLKNESDVEQFFVIRLLSHLGYTDDYVDTKATLKEENIGKGQKKRNYIPDYIGYGDRKKNRPLLIIDAKSPTESAEDGVRDAQLYASVLRRRLDEPKPEIYCLGTSGTRTVVRHFDRNQTEFDLLFEEFVDGNEKFRELTSFLSRQTLGHITIPIGAAFEFRKPELDEVRGIFEACHEIIWRKDNMSPQAAFYEFSKLMFVKLREDRRLRDDLDLKRLIDTRQPLPPEKVVFSVGTILKNEEVDPNPINLMLFRRLRESLEYEIGQKRKKRIFDADEELRLKPSTVKEVVKYLEHYDLFGIDVDLNGRMFETFLSATMRGPGLGQFFTPRSVVDFMTALVDLCVTAEHVDTVLDLCCGTGGFLIEAMAQMAEKTKELVMLTESDKEEILKSIRDDNLYGIDAGTDPPIARIARINMYLHGDGGSHIFFADALNKCVSIEEGLEAELRTEREELQALFVKQGRLFDVALTNPPFAKRYNSAEPDGREILEQYQLSWYNTPDGTRKRKASLKSNVMFLERYYDLLQPSGTLCTIIDESVLNTQSDKEVRRFILERFYIRAIISLPQWAFFEAGSNVKTSILLLTKKKDLSNDQPSTFYARCENIGYDRQKPDRSKDELPLVLSSYQKYTKTGRLPKITKTTWSDKSRFFTAKLTPITERFDFEFLDPRHVEMNRRFKSLAEERGYEVAGIDELCDIFRGKTADLYVSSGIPIIKVRNVTGEGITWAATSFVLREFFESHPDCHLKPQDILLTSTGLGTIGRVDILERDVPCMTDGHVSILRVKDSNHISPRYVLYYLRSIFGQMQMERYTVGSTGQTELNRNDVKRIMIIFPKTVQAQEELIKAGYIMEEAAIKAREEYRENLSLAKIRFAESLGLS
jgi:type I restriction enzyme M protein